jgi:hypothetical protein
VSVPTKEDTMTKSHSAKKVDPQLQNEGEGSRSAARRYDAGAEQGAKDKERPKKLATDAERALEGPEGAALREAEQRGKAAKHR